MAETQTYSLLLLKQSEDIAEGKYHYPTASSHAKGLLGPLYLGSLLFWGNFGFLLFIMYCFEFMCLSMQMSAEACRVHKTVTYPLELELQMIVHCLAWSLGTKLRSNVRTVCALKH